MMMAHVSSIDAPGEISGPSLEEKYLTHYKDSLTKISEKKDGNKPLTDADRITIRQAREFALKLQEKKDAKGLVSNQTKELEVLLQKFVDESLALKVNYKDGTNVEKKDSSTKEELLLAQYFWLKQEDIKEINFMSALDAISKNQNTPFVTHEDWEKAWYKGEGVFSWIGGVFSDKWELEQLNNLLQIKDKFQKYSTLRSEKINLVDVINTEAILKNTGSADIFKVLFDVDNSWKLDEKDNQSILNLWSIYEFVATKIENPKDEQTILKNLWRLIGKNYTNREDIYKDMLANPENKYLLLKKLTLLSGSNGSTYVTDYLLHWREGAKKSLDTRKNVDEYLNAFMEQNKASIFAKYDASLSTFIARIPESQRDKYKEIIAQLESPEQKKSIIDSFNMNSVSVFGSLVEWKKWAWIVTSFTNEDINNYFKKVVDNVNFDIGFTNIGGSFVPWIWMSIDKKIDITDETTVSGKIWFINVIPYAVISWKTQINAEEIKRQGFIDLSTSPKYVGLAVNVSTIGQWLMLTYGKDRIKWVEQWEKIFSAFLDSAITKEWKIDQAVLKSQPDYAQNEMYYKNFEKHVADYIDQTNFSTLDENQKAIVLSSLKASYQNVWREWVLKDESKKWYEFATVWVGIQWIAWFLPLPMVWVSFDKLGVSYKQDDISRWYAILWASLNNLAVAANARGTVIPGKKIDINIEDVTSTLKFNSPENQRLFVRFAQRHPNDWKKLITGNLDFNEKVAIVTKMLSEDTNKRTTFFTELRSKMVALRKDIDTLRDKTDDESKKLLVERQISLNYLVAEFLVATFKDQRSVEEVVLWFTKDEKGKKQGSFDFLSPRITAMKRFSESSWLSPEFSSNTKSLYEEIKNDSKDSIKKSGTKIEKYSIEQRKAPTLYWFVASYKINSESKSLWKGLVDIPAGQVTVLGWKEKPITNESDKNFVVKRFLETGYGKNVWNQLIAFIEKEYTGVKINLDDINTLLSTWTLDKEWKKVNLNREFVYFLYGACANESMWIKINQLVFPDSLVKDRWIIGFTGVGPDGSLIVKANTTNVAETASQNVNIGLIAGDKKPENWAVIPSNNTPWTRIEDPNTPPPSTNNPTITVDNEF